MATLTDIRELKKVLEIHPNDVSEDAALNLYIDQATSIIQEYLGRRFFFYRQYTEYLAGSGTQKLLLSGRPVYTAPPPADAQQPPLLPAPTTILAYEDRSGAYGSAPNAFDPTLTALTYGTDFCLRIDQPDGVSSRCGILVKLNDYWEKPQARATGLLSPFLAEAFGTVKVVYYGGYTLDTLPSTFRAAANLLAAKLRYLFPLGVELAGEAYEERNITILADQKAYLLNLIRPLLWGFRNVKF